MKKLILSALAFAFLMAFLMPAKAEAHQSITNLTQKQAIVQTVQAPASTQLDHWHIPPITCETPTSCVIDYYGNGSLEGYWMARQWNGTTWVRLTRVNGADWNNDYVAPISCPVEDSCVQATYYNHALDICYLMARQANGTTWVRESRVHDYGDY